jgi:hypothetical protein
LGEIISKLLFILIFAGSFLQAQEVKVFYFGGVKSQKQVLDRCYPDFRNFAYPLSEKEQKDLIEEIKSHPQQKYLLVGHSKGTSYAMNIVKAPGISNRSRLTLIDLDGFAPVGVPSNVRTVCWNAKNTSGKKSRNYSSMRAETCNEKYTVNADHCDVSSDWCLHFAVANPSVPAKLTDWGGHGYDDCAKETAEWVKMELPQSTKIPKAIKSIQSK